MAFDIWLEMIPGCRRQPGITSSQISDAISLSYVVFLLSRALKTNTIFVCGKNSIFVVKNVIFGVKNAYIMVAKENNQLLW